MNHDTQNQMKTTIPKIQASKDYALFHPNPKFQRKFNRKRVRQLSLSMKSDGYWKAEPISVFRKGGKLYINSGHHRLDAAKLAGVAVNYIVEDEWPVQRMVREGAVVNQKSWIASEAASAYAEAGMKDYVTLLHYVALGIPIKEAASMLYGESAASGNVGKFVKDGTFEVRDTKHIKHVLEIRDSVVKSNPEASSRAFITAISALLVLPEFNPRQLIARMTTNPGLLEKRSTRDQMLEQIEEIYNFRSKEKVALAFTAKEAARNRQKGVLGKKK
jgi:hypothetical protein